MLRIVILMALAAGTMATLPAAAGAIQSVQRATASVSPNIAGTRARPRAISLTVRAYFDDLSADLDRQVQFALASGRIFLPKEGITNNRLFPSCDPVTAYRNEALCPPGSRIASGTARGVGLGLDETLSMQAFNLAAGKGAVLLVVGETPLIIREVVTVTLTTLANDPKFRYELAFTEPRNLQTPAPGVIAAAKDFKLTIPAQYLKRNGRYVKRGGQRIPYIATTGCATGRWSGRFSGDYTTSFDSTIESTQTVDISVPCRRAPRR